MTAEIPKIEIISDKEHIAANKEDQLAWRQDQEAFMKGMKALQESSRTHGKDALAMEILFCLQTLTVRSRSHTQASTPLYELEEARQNINGLPLQSRY
jgi:hypothetical protein